MGHDPRRWRRYRILLVGAFAICVALLFFPPWRETRAGLPFNPWMAIFALILVYLAATQLSSLFELFKPSELPPNRPFVSSDAPPWLEQMSDARAALDGNRSNQLDADEVQLLGELAFALQRFTDAPTTVASTGKRLRDALASDTPLTRAEARTLLEEGLAASRSCR